MTTNIPPFSPATEPALAETKKQDFLRDKVSARISKGCRPALPSMRRAPRWLPLYIGRRSRLISGLEWRRWRGSSVGSFPLGWCGVEGQWIRGREEWPGEGPW